MTVPLAEDAGTVHVEYLMLLCGVTIGLASATVALGVPLQALFQLQRLWLLLPFP